MRPAGPVRHEFVLSAAGRGKNRTLPEKPGSPAGTAGFLLLAEAVGFSLIANIKYVTKR